MRYYLRILAILMRLNLSRFLAYRMNFINTVVTSIAYGIFSFVYILILTSRTPTVFGWRREELILLMALYNIVIGGFFHMFFSRNFDLFAESIHLGKLDTVLLKPIDSQFSMSFGVISYANLTRVAIGFIVAIYIISVTHMKVTLFDLVAFVALSIFGILLLYSIWFTVLTVTIWFSRLTNLVVLLYHLNDIARFPPEMLRGLGNFSLFLIPYTLILVTPTKAILERLTGWEIGYLLFLSLIFFYISRKFWQFALRFYTSAN